MELRGTRAGTGLPAGIRKVLVVGAGRSGRAAAAALRDLGLAVTLSDAKDRDSLAGLEALEATGVAFVPQGELAELPVQMDLLVKSPGVPGEAAPVAAARERGIPIWSEVELAYALLPNPFDAITGTNGKTTTTALLGHLFATAGRPARVVGNIGTAVTSLVGAMRPDEELVVEVSSFQLEDVHAFRPVVGVFLNLAPDHLDRHGTMERYLACKARIFMNQGPDDVAVLNFDDPAVAGLSSELRARPAGPRVLFFSTATEVEREGLRTLRGMSEPDSWVEGGWLVVGGERLLPAEQLLIPGRHNLENSLAAATAAMARGVQREAIAEGLRTFSGVAHRLERTGIVAGVTYVNDSKATNVDSTLAAMRAYPSGVHLILGGRDKASDYRPIARMCAGVCRAVYLIGEATPLIEEGFSAVRCHERVGGVPEPTPCGDLETAVRLAAGSAIPGEVVLLAPACSSFDQYGSFEERGEHFRRIVHALVKEKA